MRPDSGRIRSYDIVQRSRNPLLNTAFRLAVNNAIQREKGAAAACTADFGNRCKLAADSPGRIEEMHYSFQDPESGVQGHSTQLQIACRCLDWNCEHAIVMQPRVDASKKVFCFYPKVNGKWRDCNTEMLRVSEHGVYERPREFRDKHYLTVNQSQYGWWKAIGTPRINRKLNESEQYPTVKFSEIVEDYDKWNKDRKSRDFFVFGNDTSTNNALGDVYYQDANDTECGVIYTYAKRRGDTIRISQDQHAVGMAKDSYLVSRPEKVKTTDVYLAIGSGITSVFTAIGLWQFLKWDLYDGQKQRKSKIIWWRFWLKFIVILLVIVAELGVLVFTFISHLRERNWMSFFAWFDAAVALPPDVEKCNSDYYGVYACPVAKGVYVGSAVLGTVGYYHQSKGRFVSMAVTLSIILAFLAAIVGQVVLKILAFVGCLPDCFQKCVPGRCLSDRHRSRDKSMENLVSEANLSHQR
ncbi:hypothetical protein FGB62_69g261 [Gracilaria domingensis]|nr:hypothetical protein FGB62_69g261 [Gracilaria domingensis]